MPSAKTAPSCSGRNTTAYPRQQAAVTPAYPLSQLSPPPLTVIPAKVGIQIGRGLWIPLSWE